jgi:hypothetical protein
MDNEAANILALVNQPLGPLMSAQQRVAKLEAQISQADFYLGKALECEDDDHARHAIMRIARETLKEALDGRPNLGVQDM